MPRVCVAVPAYNAQSSLPATLSSAKVQTWADLEVVVVDDGSGDATAELAERFGSPVRLIRQANAGMSASRNRAISSSDSEFIALLDSDDVWHPQKIELQIKVLRERPDADFCYTGFEEWGGEPCPSWHQRAASGAIDESLSGWIYHRLVLENHALPSSWLFRRRAWEQLGPFLCEQQKTDDWEYVVRASVYCRFVRLADSLVLYRQSHGSLSSRVPEHNFGEHMRESLIERFGLQSADGAPVDSIELARQRYKGRRNFADAHCARGDLGVGMKAFMELLQRGPHRGATALSMALSLRRRLFPRT